MAAHAFVQGLKRPLHIAHRGGAGLYPENTLFAFERALKAFRTDVLELDVHTTRDGVVVVAHDDTLDRCTDGEGRLHERSLADLSRLDAAFRFTPHGGQGFPLRGHGIGIPTLAQVLALSASVRFNIELKEATALGPFVDELKRLDAFERLCIGSEHDALAAELHRALPQACHFFPRDALAAFVLSVRGGDEVIDDHRYSVLDMPLEWEGVRVFDRAIAEAARARGKWVNVWTLDDPEIMRFAIAEGVGGIMTDRPDVLRQVLG